jgi:hypothetical protein
MVKPVSRTMAKATVGIGIGMKATNGHAWFCAHLLHLASIGRRKLFQ